ncbi:amidohydrolase family protein [Amycolatopsis sp. NPDC005232]|uniref:amidohydrolase family protein n=1 Tax=Amycolatopsis sp. NPDC005232 TaxID=3157027 RepID=UPI0033AEA824
MLDAHARATADGIGRVVLLAGEPGVGKRRLVAEVVRRAGLPAAWGGVTAGIRRTGRSRNSCAHMLELSGMSTVDTFRAATSVAAGVCGPGHRKGRLAPGFDADVLAVGGNPFTDPAAIHDIRAVYVRGTAVRAPLPR